MGTYTSPSPLSSCRTCLAGECRRCAAALEERTPEAVPGKGRENLELQKQDSLLLPLVEFTGS